MTASDWTTFGKTSGGSTGSAYLRPNKLKDGHSARFRMVGSPVEYLERWTSNEKAPVIVRHGEPWPEGKKWREGKEGEPKYGVAVPSYHYEQDAIVIFSYTQKTITRQLRKYIEHPKYGSPTRYDLTLSRKGSTKDDTEYSLVPDPPEEPEAKVVAAWNRVLEAGFDLNELFVGGDPFSPTGNSRPDNDADIPF